MPRIPLLPEVKPRWDVINESLPVYVNVAHRCATNVYGEETVQGFRDAVEVGFLPELDLQQLVDGTLVGCHDDTVDRTMTNIGTGNVNTKTQVQWRAARIIPAIAGGTTHDALFWNEILDQYGGRCIIVPELKDTDVATATAFIAGIKKRGLERAVIGQCFGYATCKQLATNGITALFLSTNLPVAGSSGVPAGWTWASIKADGIDFVCFNINGNITAADVTAAKAAGLKVWGYTVNNLVDQAKADSLGMTGVFSNDPWLSSGNVQTVSAWDPEGAVRPKGMTHYYWNSVPAFAPYPQSALGTPHLSGDWLGSIGNTVIPYFHLPSYGLLNPPIRVSFRAHFGLGTGTAATLTGNIGVVLCSNPVSGFFMDSAKANQNAIAAVVRRNGQLQSWKYVAGAAAVSVNATPSAVTAGTNEVAPLASEGWIEVDVIITATTVQMIAQSPRYTSSTGAVQTAWNTPANANGQMTTPAVAHGMTTAQLANLELTVRLQDAGPSYISNVRVAPATA